MDLKKYIREVPDFPKEGINFYDITTLLKDGEAFRHVIEKLKLKYYKGVDLIVGIESRGFLFGAPLANSIGVGFVPARKAGKLPAETVKTAFALEYGTAAIELHKDSIRSGQKVLIVDDLLATGGTSKAVAELVESLGGEVVGLVFLIELTELNGKSKLSKWKVDSLLSY